MNTYFARHDLGRADICTSDADAICEAINRKIDAQGISMDCRACEKIRTEYGIDTISNLKI